MMGTVIGYLAVRCPDYDWQSQYPKLAAFSARVEQRPSFKGSVPVPQKISDKVM